MTTSIVSGTTVFIPVSSTSSDYIATNHDHVIICDVSGAGLTITLPEVGASNKGQVLTIKDIGDASGSNKITIAAHSGDSIDGDTSVEISSPSGYLTVVSYGSNNFWLIIGSG